MSNFSKEVAELINEQDVLEPDTLRQLYPSLSENEFNQIMALKTLLHTRGFWENMFIFESMVQALNGRVPDFAQMEGCTTNELWYALDIAHKFFPDREYAKEILEYIKYFFNHQGIFIYPSYLQLPNPYYSKAVYMSENGPFPLGESTEEIQASKFLEIQEYIKNQKGII